MHYTQLPGMQVHPGHDEDDMLKMVFWRRWLEEFPYGTVSHVSPAKPEAPALLPPDIARTAATWFAHDDDREYLDDDIRNMPGLTLTVRYDFQEGLDGQWVLIVAKAPGRLIYRVAAKTEARMREVMRLATEGKEAQLPEAEPNPRIIPVTFSYIGINGRPDDLCRDISVPLWKDIRQNYTAHLRTVMDELMAYTPETLPQGKIILLHGVPGTGKTHLLRALGAEWRWAHFQYIIDPEILLNHGPYLIKTILGHPGWHLVVMEDAGELIAKDARERSGQGLSRLLNATDGILGQGTNVIWVITTNERHDGLHEAVSRHGRALKSQIVLPLTAEEATEWLGEEWDPEETATLANLYAEREARKAQRTAAATAAAEANGQPAR